MSTGSVIGHDSRDGRKQLVPNPTMNLMIQKPIGSICSFPQCGAAQTEVGMILTSGPLQFKCAALTPLRRSSIRLKSQML